MDEEYTIVSASGYNKPCLMYENVFPNTYRNENLKESKKSLDYLESEATSGTEELQPDFKM